MNDEAAVSGRIGSNDTNHLPTITYLDKEIEKMKPSTILMSTGLMPTHINTVRKRVYEIKV